MTISLIAAIGKNRELGKNNTLLWHIPEDLKRFKKLTSGHPIIMGRKTYESIGRVLPNRTNIIVTRDKQYAISGAIIVYSLEEAIEEGRKYYVSSSKYDPKIHNTQYIIRDTEHEVFVIGGGQIFQQVLPLASKLYLTVVDGSFDADTFFPDYSMFTKVIRKEEGRSGEYSYTFIDLEREQ